MLLLRRMLKGNDPGTVPGSFAEGGLAGNPPGCAGAGRGCGIGCVFRRRNARGGGGAGGPERGGAVFLSL